MKRYLSNIIDRRGESFMRKRALKYFLALVCLMFSACSACIFAAETDLSGTYVFEDGEEKDVLVLEKDHALTRTLYVKSTGQTTTEKGGWKYPDDNGNVSLGLTDQNDPSKTRSDSKAAENWFGQLYIGMSEDHARQYKKID